MFGLIAGSLGRWVGQPVCLAGAVLFLDGPSPWCLSLVQPFSWYVVGVSWASGPATCALERAAGFDVSYAASVYLAILPGQRP